MRKRNKTSPCIALLKGFDIFKCVLRHTRLKPGADMWLSCSKCHISASAEESESKWQFGVWRRDCCCEILCIQNGRYPVSYFILNKEINLETFLFYVVDTSIKRGDLNSWSLYVQIIFVYGPDPVY